MITYYCRPDNVTGRADGPVQRIIMVVDHVEKEIARLRHTSSENDGLKMVGSYFEININKSVMDTLGSRLGEISVV
jgi:hypothetical protein